LRILLVQEAMRGEMHHLGAGAPIDRVGRRGVIENGIHPQHSRNPLGLGARTRQIARSAPEAGFAEHERSHGLLATSPRPRRDAGTLLDRHPRGDGRQADQLARLG
jgi:hypothetical protein